MNTSWNLPSVTLTASFLPRTSWQAMSFWCLGGFWLAGGSPSHHTGFNSQSVTMPERIWGKPPQTHAYIYIYMNKDIDMSYIYIYLYKYKHAYIYACVDTSLNIVGHAKVNTVLVNLWSKNPRSTTPPAAARPCEHRKGRCSPLPAWSGEDSSESYPVTMTRRNLALGIYNMATRRAECISIYIYIINMYLYR